MSYNCALIIIHKGVVIVSRKFSASGKLVALLLLLTMMASVFPAAALGADLGDFTELRDTTAVYQRGDGLEPTASDDAVLFPESADLAGIDRSGIDTRLRDSKGVNARSVLTTARDAGVDTESLSYVESIAEELTEPVGIVDVEGSGTKHVFVWLQSLPDSLERVYQQHGARNSRYETARRHGQTARSSIRNSHRSQITYEYSEVFSGFAMDATVEQLEQIAAMDGVFAITEVGYQTMDYDPDPGYATPGNAAAREIWGIGELHADGFDGSGVKVGIIDSGIDATHPDLQGAYKGGFNFAPRGPKNPGGRTDDMSTPDEDHGTHVSGIVASQGLVALGMAPGVELYMAQVFTPDDPNAARDDDITAAIEAFCGGTLSSPYAGCTLPKVDIINMSLGVNVDKPYSADHFARNNACIAGVLVVNSAGNNAYQDIITQRNNYTLGSGGVSLPISVAASKYGGNPVRTYSPAVSNTADYESDPFEVYIENGDAALADVFWDGMFGQQVPHDFTWGLSDSANNYNYPVATYTIQPLKYIEGKGYEVFYACAGNVPTPPGTGGSDMTAAEITALQNMEPGSLAGKILAVNRGQAFYDYKGQAHRLGAGALIVINRTDEIIGNLNIGSETSANDLIIFSAPSSVKQIMYDAVQNGQTAYLDPGNLSFSGHPLEPTGFSSIGPVISTVEIKPDIIAPGYNILSTALNGGYTEMGGTSMSSPAVAGLAALVKQAYPEASVLEIKARLMNTADPFLLGPSTSNNSANGKYYYDADGAEISVFEQGAGFANPYRAIYEDIYITVENTVPTGNEDESLMTADMASFSFGMLEQGESTDALTATVHGGAVSSIEVVYNHDTRYSNKNLDGAVTVFYEINGETFDVWLEIDEDANDDYLEDGNLYEGYILATVGDGQYVLPWACRIGDAPSADDWLLFPDRPVQATYNNANQDWSPYSSQNYIYFQFWGDDLADSVVLRTTGSGNRLTYFMDIILFDAVTEKPAYRYQVQLASNLPAGYTLSDFLWCDGRVYQIGTTARAYAINANGTWATSVSNIAAGSYYVGLEFNESGRNYYNWYLQLGITFSNTRPTISLDGIGTLPFDANTYHEYAYGADEVTVDGRLYSAAIDEAANAGRTGFYWAGLYLLQYDVILELDQSYNVLVDPASGLDLEVDDVYGSWFCDEDGYFSLTYPVQDDGRFFDKAIFEDLLQYGYDYTLYNPNRIVYATDAFDVSNITGNSFTYYGCLASYMWGPITYEWQDILVVDVDLNNIEGKLTAWFEYQGGDIPEELDADALTVELFFDGEFDKALTDFEYDPATGAAVWSFDPYIVKAFEPVGIAATVFYEGVYVDGYGEAEDISIYILSAGADAFVTVMKGNTNDLTITVTEYYSNGSKIDYSKTFAISNNAAGTYAVDVYKVYVDTKGNDQIRSCYITNLPV